MRPPATRFLAVAALLALAACQDPDVGRPCKLGWNETWEADGTQPPPTPQTAAGDYFETGNLGCDDLVCIVSPAAAGTDYGECSDAANWVCGYCSKPCVSNRDCDTEETGLVCDLLLLDPEYLGTLDPETRQRYLSDVVSSSYCVVPR
jgi:hypothetical protein